GYARDHLGAIHRLLAEAPRFPSLRARKREAHGDGLLASTCKPHLAVKTKWCGRLASADRADHELDLAFHLPAVEVAEPGLHLQPPVARFELRVEAHPIDRDRADVLEADRTPDADRNLPAVRIRQARISRRRVGLQLAVVEDAHHVPLLLGLRLDRRLAADDEQVLGLQVGREVEAKRREIAVVRAQQLAVEPRMRGEKRTADAQQHAPCMVRALELGAIPHRLAAFMRSELARHLDRLPTRAASDRQPFGLAFAEGHPRGFPATELAHATRPLRQREKQAVAQSEARRVWRREIRWPGGSDARSRRAPRRARGVYAKARSAEGDTADGPHGRRRSAVTARRASRGSKVMGERTVRR